MIPEMRIDWEGRRKAEAGKSESKEANDAFPHYGEKHKAP